MSTHDHPHDASQLRRGCARSRARLSDFLDGTLTRRQRVGLWAHVAMCSGCRRVLRNFTSVVQILRTLDDSDAAPRQKLDLEKESESRAEGMAKRWRRDA